MLCAVTARAEAKIDTKVEVIKRIAVELGCSTQCRLKMKVDARGWENVNARWIREAWRG